MPYPTDDVRSMTKAAVEAVYRVSDLVSNTSKLKFSWSPSVKKASTPKTFFLISEPVANEMGQGNNALGQCADQSRLGNASGDDLPERYDSS
ncbi:hypothetical protein D3C75_718950 [compost metagenome]